MTHNNSLISLTPKIVKIPYEEGTYWRKGAKYGPDAIIEQTTRIHGYSLALKNSLKYNIEDLIHEHTYIPIYSKMEALSIIESNIKKLVEDNFAPVCLGGDHSITLPILRALTSVYGKGNFGLIHFDAHSDTFDDVDGFKYHHGAFVRHLVDEGLVNGTDIVQLGVRGFVRGEGLSYANSMGISYFSVNELEQSNFNLSKYISRRDIPYYISIDIDVVDPTFAPGTGTPIPGGFSSREMLNMLTQLFDLDIIGLDIMEVAPIYDSENITSLLAAHILCESLTGIEFKGLQRKKIL